MNEKEAKEKFGEENVLVYTDKWSETTYNVQSDGNKAFSFAKVICNKKDKNRILGIQCMGKGMDEALQGFSVAIKMGATLEDFHKAVAIHPTSAENFVLLNFHL